MLMCDFRCLGCRRSLRIGAELVRPRVRCPRCNLVFVLPATRGIRLGKGRKPELIGLMMSRSRN